MKTILHHYRAGYINADTAALQLATLYRAAKTDTAAADVRKAAESIGVRFNVNFKG